jgi:outer membrane lipoprotein-sorting protein
MIQKMLIFSLLFVFFALFGRAQSAYDLTLQMIAKVKAIKTAKFTFVTKERIGNKWTEQKSSVKMQHSPLMIYYKQEYPKVGLELLYVHGKNDNNALINTNGFPWVNVSLNPYSSTMTEDQHHTIYDMGLQSLSVILEHLWKKYDKNAPSMVKLEGDVMWDGHSCYQITMENPSFKFVDYTVQKGESLFSIARKLKVNEYMIKERNNLPDFYAVKEGQVIKVPEDYAKKMILYLDKKRLLPLVMKVYDDKGLYEDYMYFGLEVNPVILPEEFTTTYKGYGF